MKYSESNKVSVVTCHHTGDLINDFVRTISDSQYVSFDVTIMTSDPNLKFEGCKSIHSTTMPAEKRNIGVANTRGEYIAFFDDDTEIDPQCLYSFLNTFKEKPDCGMVYGKLHKYGTRRFDEAGGYLTWNGFIWSRAEQNILDDGQYDEREPIFAGKSASCMIRRDVFEAIGGFDKDFEILGEESDLSWRVWLSGFKVYYEPKAFGYHKFNTHLKPANKYYTSERVQYNGCRNYITMLIKNLGKEHLWIIPLQMLIWAFVGLAMIGTGKLKQGKNVWKGLYYVISNRKEILRKRSATQASRRVSDRDIWNHIYRRTSLGYYIKRFFKYLSIGLHG